MHFEIFYRNSINLLEKKLVELQLKITNCKIRKVDSNLTDDSRNLTFVKPKVEDHYSTTVDDIASKLPLPAIVKEKIKFPIYIFGDRILR